MPKNLEIQKANQRKHYLANKEKYIAATCFRRKKNKRYIDEYKQGKCCKECGETNVTVFEFHHKNAKTKEILISKAVRDWGLIRIKEELNKCQILCANCHRKLHCQDTPATTKNKKRIKNRKFIVEHKENNPCKHCKESHVACLDFHHLHDKEVEISRAIQDWGLTRLKKEIEKCIVICTNCHRILHDEERNVSGCSSIW